MKRFSLMAILLVVIFLCTTATATATKRSVMLLPVEGSPSPDAGGILLTEYHWTLVYGEYGEVVGKVWGASTTFEFGGLEPNATYTLVGWNITKYGQGYVPIESNYDMLHTDGSGSVEGIGYSETGIKYDYYELWAGDYYKMTQEERNNPTVVLRSVK